MARLYLWEAVGLFGSSRKEAASRNPVARDQGETSVGICIQDCGLQYGVVTQRKACPSRRGLWCFCLFDMNLLPMVFKKKFIFLRDE